MPSQRRADDLPNMREFTDLLRTVCKALIECGCSSNRVELLTQRLGASWGFEVETLAIPTGAWISVRQDGKSMIELTRVHTWSVDLDRLVRINDLIDSVHEHKMGIAEANRKFAELAGAPPPYSKSLTLAAGGVAAAVLIYNYQGTPAEILLGIPIGMTVQFLSKYIFTAESNRYLADFLCAVIVATIAVTAAAFIPGLDAPKVIVGGTISLMPGLVFVNSVHEVAQKNLVSGAAKILETMMITASLGCGVIFVLAAKILLGGL